MRACVRAWWDRLRAWWARVTQATPVSPPDVESLCDVVSFPNLDAGGGWVVEFPEPDEYDLKKLAQLRAEGRIGPPDSAGPPTLGGEELSPAPLVEEEHVRTPVPSAAELELARSRGWQIYRCRMTGLPIRAKRRERSGLMLTKAGEVELEAGGYVVKPFGDAPRRFVPREEFEAHFVFEPRT